jgi:hypothetical protein
MASVQTPNGFNNRVCFIKKIPASFSIQTSKPLELYKQSLHPNESYFKRTKTSRSK